MEVQPKNPTAKGPADGCEQPERPHTKRYQPNGPSRHPLATHRSSVGQRTLISLSTKRPRPRTAPPSQRESLVQRNGAPSGASSNA